MADQKQPTVMESATNGHNGHGDGGDGNGEVEQVPELPAYLYRALERLAPREGFTEGKFSIAFDFGSSKGDGFVGQMFKAVISEGERKEVYLCKIPPLDDARREQFSAMTAFAREAFVYERFLPLIFEYQREKGVESREDGFFHAPHCYYAHCDEAAQESVIVMEDLRLREFRLWDKRQPVDYEHARLFMTHLGRLHAISLALKRDRPEEFEQFKLPNPFDPILEEDGPFRNMILSQMQMVIDAMDVEETEALAKLEQLKANIFRELLRCGDASLAEPYAVAGHGDCWTNNMMFRYQDVTPTNIKLIDWQLSRYGSPVLDLVYFIFNCTDEELRSHSYHRLLSIYYDSLSKHLHNLGGNVDKLFPRSAFRDHLKRFGRYGFLMSLMVMPIICTPNDELPDTNETMEKLMKDMTNGTESEMVYGTTEKAAARYRKRMSGAIRDVISYVQQQLLSVAEGEGFNREQVKINYEPGSKSGDGYIGQIVRARFVTANDPTNSLLSVICKFPPEDRKQRERFHAMLLFERELFIYQRVLPAFEELQEKQGVTRAEGTYFGNYPKCYRTYFDRERGEAVLILEDLTDSKRPGLKLLDQYQPVNYEHVRVLMQALGKLNACSFALKLHRPEVFDELRQLNDLLSIVLDTEQTRPLTPRNCRLAASAFDPQKEPARYHYLLELCNDMWPRTGARIRGVLAEPYAALNHGDCWTSNVMFGYDTEGNVNEVCLFDWQMARYSSPVLDYTVYDVWEAIPTTPCHDRS
ncbi:hypothetical protein ZHAS_00008763 [Anopheles sinensis]|uniref:CHK kinase-like domain-containing protein n=1 Tax=Anopheles sinensis TaxID=74873 RepID=A0A084VTA5_ANOSI|nr:hypothetical protein ZHAS_00008763 [Anopheles sinensis]